LKALKARDELTVFDENNAGIFRPSVFRAFSARTFLRTLTWAVGPGYYIARRWRFRVFKDSSWKVSVNEQRGGDTF